MAKPKSLSAAEFVTQAKADGMEFTDNEIRQYKFREKIDAVPGTSRPNTKYYYVKADLEEIVSKRRRRKKKKATRGKPVSRNAKKRRKKKVSRTIPLDHMDAYIEVADRHALSVQMIAEIVHDAQDKDILVLN